MQYKAVVVDLDGTAVDSPVKKVVSPRLRDAIGALEQVGVKVCAATGRPEMFAWPVLQSMSLKEPVIVAGGTKIIDASTRKELWRCSIDPETMHKVVAILKKYPYRYLWNDYEEVDYVENGGWELVDFASFNACHFFEIVYVPTAEAPALAAEIEKLGDIAATLTIAQRPGMNDIHVTHKLATKEHAIYELAKMIGVTKEQIIGVGDGHNDLHLFSAVGRKIAMGNAVEDLKAAADEVIGSIKEDGLAIYFEQLAMEARNEV